MKFICNTVLESGLIVDSIVTLYPGVRVQVTFNVVLGFTGSLQVRVIVSPNGSRGYYAFVCIVMPPPPLPQRFLVCTLQPAVLI